MIRKSLLIINHDSKISKSLERSKRLGVSLNVDAVMNGLVGQEIQELCFSKVKLEAVVLNPYVQEPERAHLRQSCLEKQSEDNFIVQSKPKSKSGQPTGFQVDFHH